MEKQRDSILFSKQWCRGNVLMQMEWGVGDSSGG